jgi:hypothetical protein
MEIKQEIVQIVNKLPAEVLGELLQYLRHVEKSTPEKMRLSLNLNTILTEDRELLEKLALDEAKAKVEDSGRSKTFDPIRLDTKEFKFSREEANEG